MYELSDVFSSNALMMYFMPLWDFLSLFFMGFSPCSFFPALLYDYVPRWMSAAGHSFSTAVTCAASTFTSATLYHKIHAKTNQKYIFFLLITLYRRAMYQEAQPSQSTSSEETLFRIFATTLSAEKLTRQSAEERLQLLAQQDPHFLLHLLRLSCASPDVLQKVFQTTDASTRSVLQCAAIRLRNEVGRGDWNRNGQITEEVKARVRDALVPLQCQPHVSEAIRRQLLATTEQIITVDYGRRWPQLLDQVTSLMGQSLTALHGVFSQSSCQEVDDHILLMMLQQLRGALGILRACCKYYENPLKVTSDEVDEFSTQMVPSLISAVERLSGWWATALSTQLPQLLPPSRLNAFLEFPPLVDELSHCLRLSLKCIFSMFSGRWVLCLCTVESFDQFYHLCFIQIMQAFQQWLFPVCRARLEHLLHQPSETNSSLQQLRGDHFSQFQQSAPWKLCKWCISIAYKLTQEFASPKSVEGRCRVVAQHFSRQYLCPTVQTALDLVRWHADPPLAQTSKAYIMALEVLTTAVGHKDAYLSILQPNAEELMTVLLFPRLAFTAEEEELWVDNPEEYIRKQTNPAGDVYSAKVVSTSLLMSLAVSSKRFHDKNLIGSLVNFLMNQLQTYLEPAAKATSNEDMIDLYSPAVEAARRIDAALYCLYQFKRVLMAMKFGDDKLEYVLTGVVVPVAQYSLGFLRARAVLVLSTFAPTLKWSSPQAYQSALQPVLHLLNDPEAPVRMQACICFSRLVCHPYARDVITPCIAELIQHYVAIMRMMDNESVVATLRRTISFYRDTLSQWALDLTDMLVSHFAVVLERVTTKYNAMEAMDAAAASTTGGVAEAFLDDDGFSDVLMAADELIETLTTLVKSLPESPVTTARRSTAATVSPEVLNSDVFIQIQHRVAPMLFVILSHQSGSSYGFMDPALSLLTTLLSRSPSVAAPMWKLVWCLQQLVVRSGAVDYIGQLVAPLDNFVSVDAAPFLFQPLFALAQEPLPPLVQPDGAKTPAQLVFSMCEAALQSDALRDMEVAAVPRINDALVQGCWAIAVQDPQSIPVDQATALVDYIVRQTLQTIGTRSRIGATLQVLLANTIFSCLLTDAGTALQVLVELQAVRRFFERYVAVVFSTVSVDGATSAVMGLLRSYDRSLLVHAFVACMRLLRTGATATTSVAAGELTASLQGLVSCGVLQHFAEEEATAAVAELRHHQRRIVKLSKLLGVEVEETAPSAAQLLGNKTRADGMGEVGDGGDGEEEEWEDDGDDDDMDGSSDSDAEEWMSDGDEEDEDEMFEDDDGDGEADMSALQKDGQLESMLHQAQQMRQRSHGGAGGDATGVAPGADGDDDAGVEEDNVLADDDFTSPIDALNPWSALVEEVELGGSQGSGSRSLVDLLRSATYQVQAESIMRVKGITEELQRARVAHAALLEQKKSI